LRFWILRINHGFRISTTEDPASHLDQLELDHGSCQQMDHLFGLQAPDFSLFLNVEKPQQIEKTKALYRQPGTCPSAW